MAERLNIESVCLRGGLLSGAAVVNFISILEPLRA
jgi:hypothetical protein